MHDMLVNKTATFKVYSFLFSFFRMNPDLNFTNKPILQATHWYAF